MRYKQMYPGVDLVFKANRDILKYDFLVAPGANPGAIAMEYSGADSVSLDTGTGGLSIHLGSMLLIDARPVAYQETPDGRTPVEARYRLDENRFAFDVGSYDASLPLVIDPALNYSSYYGASDRDIPAEMLKGRDGFLYLTGDTVGTGFPVTQGRIMGSYVMKFDPSTKSVIRCIIVTDAIIQAACIDGQGAVYVTGTSAGARAYTTPGAFCQTYNGGSTDAFVMKMAPNITSVEYGTYLGSKSIDYGKAIAVDSRGCAYVGGRADGSNFPSTPDALSPTFSDGGQQWFLSKLSPNGSRLEYSSRYGFLDDVIIVDDEDNVYIGGSRNADYPITQGAYFTNETSFQLVKVASDLKTVSFSTYFPVQIIDMTVDGLGNVHVTGTAQSGLPVTSDAFQNSSRNSECAFITVLDPTGSNLVYSTYVGGSGSDHGISIDVDGEGTIYLTGWTFSNDFPVSRGAYADHRTGNSDMFVVKHAPGEENLSYATYLGGSNVDEGIDILSLDDGGAVVWGITKSSDFPTTSDAYDTSLGGSQDTVLTFTGELVPPRLLEDATPSSVGTGEDLTFRVNATDNTEVGDVIVEYWYDDPDDVKAIDLALVSGTRQNGTWEHDQYISPDTPATLRYRVVVLDRAGAADIGAPRDVTVLDRANPVLTFGPQGPATTGEAYNITATVNDNWMVASVHVNYWFGDDPASAVNATMTGLRLGGHKDGTYFFDAVQVPSNSTEGLRYFIAASDESGNWAVSDERFVMVMDNDGPELLADLSDAQATTGDDFTITARVRDNVGIRRVRASYRIGTGSIKDLLLEAVEANRTYSGAITIPEDFTGPFVYWFSVSDAGGLTTSFDNVTLTVTDNDPPTVVMDLTEGTPMSGVAFTIRVEVSDNIGIAGVQLHYALEDRTPVETAMAAGTTQGVFTVTIDVPLDYAGTLTYGFLVTDGAGNSFESDDHTVEVIDGLPPWLGDDSSDTVALKGLTLRLAVVAGDNVGLQGVSAAIYVGGTLVETLAMALDGGTYAATHDIPRDATGTLGYSFIALDHAGNSDSTRVIELPIANAPPALDITEWTVVEGVPSELDLAPHLTDANDDVAGLTVSLTDPDISVDGRTLRVLYDAWRADRVVRVTVSDGEDAVTVNLTVRVTNVNDAPVFSWVAPDPGSKYVEGAEILFDALATDEDGDELAYVWKVGGTVLHEGKEFRYSGLKAGEHVVTVEVSDGNASTVQEVHLTVTKKERDSPGPTLVLAISALAATSLLSRGARRHHR